MNNKWKHSDRKCYLQKLSSVQTPTTKKKSSQQSANREQEMFEIYLYARELFQIYSLSSSASPSPLIYDENKLDLFVRRMKTNLNIVIWILVNLHERNGKFGKKFRLWKVEDGTSASAQIKTFPINELSDEPNSCKNDDGLFIHNQLAIVNKKEKIR